MEGWIGAVGEWGRVGGGRGAPSGARRGVVGAAAVVRRLLLAVAAAQKGPAGATRKHGVSAAGGGVTAAAAARGARASVGPAGAVCGAMDGRAGAGPLWGWGRTLCAPRNRSLGVKNACARASRAGGRWGESMGGARVGGGCRWAGVRRDAGRARGGQGCLHTRRAAITERSLAAAGALLRGGPTAAPPRGVAPRTLPAVRPIGRPGRRF